MAIKNIIAQGIGFTPGGILYVVTHGFTVGEAPPTWTNINTSDNDIWSEVSSADSQTWTNLNTSDNDIWSEVST